MNMESGVGESLIKTGLKRASTARQYHTSLPVDIVFSRHLMP